VPQVGQDTGGRSQSRIEAAEERLRSLELFGMRFGLERMRRLMTALGSPERRFDSLQVLGTNGKSSTTRMTAAILSAHGLRTAAYLSPHLVSYRERVLIDGREMDGDDFVAAIERAGRAAERVNRTLAEGDHVTQFELLTAAALWHLAEQGVDVAVVEAGLGGRYDATSVIEPAVSVLTNIGLEHTRWLGPTVRHIAEEKLAAVPVGGTLVLGSDLAPEALEVARAVASERSARSLTAPAVSADTTVRAPGRFQRANLALARAAAEAYLQARGISWRERAFEDAAASVEVPGRLQRLDEDPLTILDAAHNPHAVSALVQSLPTLVGGRRLALVLGVLEDKDAASMLAELLALSERAWFTAPPSARALSPAALQSLARQQGFERSECEPSPARALEQAREWARRNDAAVLVTGSVYLVGDVLAAHAQAPLAREPAR
jgi:dihydrofolate synthase/folylpolyglutamate synthase